MVIIMVVTILLFGVFSMMSSYAGLSIARRNAEWTHLYYQQESRAAESLFAFHQVLEKAWEETERDRDHWQQAYYENVLEHVEGTKEFFELEYEVYFPRENRTDAILQGFFLIPGDLADKTKDFYVAFEAVPREREAPEIMITAWKSMPEAFEYEDGIQFRDVEVD